MIYGNSNNNNTNNNSNDNKCYHKLSIIEITYTRSFLSAFLKALKMK